jgi:hypothetical protein
MPELIVKSGHNRASNGHVRNDPTSRGLKAPGWRMSESKGKPIVALAVLGEQGRGKNHLLRN